MKQPKDLQGGSINGNIEVYAGYEDFCYIGGPSSSEPQQIYVKSLKELKRLHVYLGKIIAWLESKKK